MHDGVTLASPTVPHYAMGSRGEHLKKVPEGVINIGLWLINIEKYNTYLDFKVTILLEYVANFICLHGTQ